MRNFPLSIILGTVKKLKIDENIWKCHWCDDSFQGINSDKALAHIIDMISMYINIYLDYIEK